MEFLKPAVAGTMESSDIMITVEKNDSDKVSVDLTSAVSKQFGTAILQVIEDTVSSMDVKGVTIKAVDKGALDCTIRARVQTALQRACGESNYIWGGKQ